LLLVAATVLTGLLLLLAASFWFKLFALLAFGWLLVVVGVECAGWLVGWLFGRGNGDDWCDSGAPVALAGECWWWCLVCDTNSTKCQLVRGRLTANFSSDDQRLTIPRDDKILAKAHSHYRPMRRLREERVAKPALMSSNRRAASQTAGRRQLAFLAS